VRVDTTGLDVGQVLRRLLDVVRSRVPESLGPGDAPPDPGMPGSGPA
jgi:hypothetical protein